MDISLKDFEIPLDLIKPANSSAAVGSKKNIKKRMLCNSPVAEKEIGKFKKNDSKLFELEKEVKLMNEICRCRYVLAL